MKNKEATAENFARLLPENISLMGIFDIIIGVNSYRLDQKLPLCSGSAVRNLFYQREKEFQKNYQK